MPPTTRAALAFIISSFLATPSHGAVLQDAPAAVRPAFEKLVVNIEPSGLQNTHQPEELRIEATGRCWYEVEGRAAPGNALGLPAAVSDHELSQDHIRRLNELLEATQWLAAPGGAGPATHTHPTTITLTLTRDGRQQTVICHGRRPAPYASLLHAIQGVATQERRIYLHQYVGGEIGTAAWAETGRELAALRGDPYGEPPFQIDYRRYLPIARRILRPFHTRDDDELVPAVRLIGHFKAESELQFLHQMAHDRSSNLRREVAWALWRIRNPDSLPVLTSMMSAPANREAAGLRLIQWGEPAVPAIVKLIEMSTDPRREPWEHTAGEDMIRACLDHWNKLDHPLDPRVTAAVRQALHSVPPDNGLLRTTYHQEFLRRIEEHGAAAPMR